LHVHEDGGGNGIDRANGQHLEEDLEFARCLISCFDGRQKTHAFLRKTGPRIGMPIGPGLDQQHEAENQVGANKCDQQQMVVHGMGNVQILNKNKLILKYYLIIKKKMFLTNLGDVRGIQIAGMGI